MTSKEIRRDIHMILADIILVKNIWLDDIVFDIVQFPSEYLRQNNYFDSFHIWRLQHPNIARDLYAEIYDRYRFRNFNNRDFGNYLLVGIVHNYRQENH